MPLFKHSQTLKLVFLKKLYLSYFSRLKLAETLLEAHQHNVVKKDQSPKTEHRSISYELQASIVTYHCLDQDCAF